MTEESEISGAAPTGIGSEEEGVRVAGAVLFPITAPSARQIHVPEVVVKDVHVADGRLTLPGSTELDMAVGPDYIFEAPLEFVGGFLLSLDNPEFGPCRVDAEATLLDTRVDGDAVSLRSLDVATGSDESVTGVALRANASTDADATIRVSVLYSAVASLNGEQCSVNLGGSTEMIDELLVEWIIDVRLRVPRSARFALDPRCADASKPLIQPEVPFRIAVMALDRDGNELSPANTGRAVAFSVLGNAEDAGFERRGALLTAFGSSSQLDARATTGDEVSIAVVTPDAINGVDLEFALLAAKGYEPLQDGQTVARHATNEWPLVPLINQLYADTVPLCTPHRPGDFELASLTLQTCQATDLSDWTFQWRLDEVGASGLTVQPQSVGACNVRLEASAFDNGAGFSSELSVVFEEAQR